MGGGVKLKNFLLLYVSFWKILEEYPHFVIYQFRTPFLRKVRHAKEGTKPHRFAELGRFCFSEIDA